MSSAQNRGQFVWHELMTTDASGAGEFYPRIAGWKTQPWGQDGSYTLWVGETGPIGGVMSLSQEAAPAASNWMPYIGTPDIAATVAAARELGATVCKDVTEIPDGGSYAVLQDPQGVAFAIHAAAPGQPEWQVPGDFSWHELGTTDIDAALRFYSQLFGWEAGERHDMGEIGFYQLFGCNGVQLGGIYVASPGMTPHWLSYMRVADVDEATDAARSAGGRVIHGPMEVPGGDWIAQILDPQGAAFAVHEITPKKAAKPAASPKAEKKPEKAKPATRPAQKAAAPAVAEAPARKAKPVARRSAARKSKSATRRAAARRSAARRPAARKKASRSRSSVRAAASRNERLTKSKRSVKAKRKSAAPKRKAGATRRRSLVRRKKAVRKSARRLVRAKRRR